MSEAMVGRKGKCPKCAAVFQLNPSKKNRWYVQTSDGRQRGPLARSELTGLDPFCQVRREDWVDWKWAEDVLPELALKGETKPADAAAATGAEPLPPPSPPPPPAPIAPVEDDATPSLSLCPDCGKPVSVRAGQCPHCGCPAADVAQRGTPVAALARGGEDVGPRPRGQSWKRNLIGWIGVASVVVVIASVLIGLFVVRPIWKTWQAADETLSQLDQILDLPEEPPFVAPLETPPVAPPEPPTGPPGLLEPDEARQCIEEASAAYARRVDDSFRQAHVSGLAAGLKQFAELSETMQALAQGGHEGLDSLDALLDADSAAQPQSYESQYDAFLAECKAHVEKKVRVDRTDREAIWAAAAEWEQAKRAASEKQLLEQLESLLGP